MLSSMSFSRIGLRGRSCWRDQVRSMTLDMRMTLRWGSSAIRRFDASCSRGGQRCS